MKLVWLIVSSATVTTVVWVWMKKSEHDHPPYRTQHLEVFWFLPVSSMYIWKEVSCTILCSNSQPQKISCSLSLLNCRSIVTGDVDLSTGSCCFIRHPRSEFVFHPSPQNQKRFLGTTLKTKKAVISAKSKTKVFLLVGMVKMETDPGNPPPYLFTNMSGSLPSPPPYGASSQSVQLVRTVSAHT